MIYEILEAINIARMKKDTAEEILSNVPEDKIFYLNNGLKLRNLKDLHQALAEMQDDTFSHHVNSKKNDFSCWITNVINDKRLAKEIVKTKSKDVLFNKVDKRISQLQSIK
ncbi:MAG: hypothetical protein ABIJ34_04260 [archaeon]